MPNVAESGCYPVTLNHRITERRPGYYVGILWSCRVGRGWILGLGEARLCSTRGCRENLMRDGLVFQYRDSTTVLGLPEMKWGARTLMRYGGESRLCLVPSLARSRTTSLVRDDHVSQIYQPRGRFSHAGYLPRYQNVVCLFATAPQAAWTKR